MGKLPACMSFSVSQPTNIVYIKQWKVPAPVHCPCHMLHTVLLCRYQCAPQSPASPTPFLCIISRPYVYWIGRVWVVLHPFMKRWLSLPHIIHTLLLQLNWYLHFLLYVSDISNTLFIHGLYRANRATSSACAGLAAFIPYICSA